MPEGTASGSSLAWKLSKRLSFEGGFTHGGDQETGPQTTGGGVGPLAQVMGQGTC